MRHYHFTFSLLVLLCGAMVYNIHLLRKMQEQEATLTEVLKMSKRAAVNAAKAANNAAEAASNASDAYQMAMEARDLADEAQYQARQR